MYLVFCDTYITSYRQSICDCICSIRDLTVRPIRTASGKIGLYGDVRWMPVTPILGQPSLGGGAKEGFFAAMQLKRRRKAAQIGHQAAIAGMQPEVHR